MKKGILLLSTVGAAAAGVVYALEVNRRKQNKQANGNGESEREPESSGNGRAVATASAETDESGEQNEQASSMARVENGKATVPDGDAQHVIDDQGTDQFEAAQILRQIRDGAFEASDEKLALALGRPTEEIEQWTSGVGLIDGDVVMKARVLAIQRGLEF